MEMLKSLFSRPAVPKVGENSIFFLVLYLSTDQNRNYAGREIFFLIFQGDDLEFWRQSPPKINGVNLKNYFDKKNKISKKSKFKSESPHPPRSCSEKRQLFYITEIKSHFYLFLIKLCFYLFLIKLDFYFFSNELSFYLLLKFYLYIFLIKLYLKINKIAFFLFLIKLYSFKNQFLLFK